MAIWGKLVKNCRDESAKISVITFCTKDQEPVDDPTFRAPSK